VSWESIPSCGQEYIIAYPEEGIYLTNKIIKENLLNIDRSTEYNIEFFCSQLIESQFEVEGPITRKMINMSFNLFLKQMPKE